jgi:hypothetical protein
MLDSFYAAEKLTHKVELRSGMVFRGLLATVLHDVTWHLSEDGLLEVRVFMRHPDRGTGGDCMMHQSVQTSLPDLKGYEFELDPKDDSVLRRDNLRPLRPDIAEAVTKAIQEACLKAWMHEFHEGIWYDEKPLTDPHPEYEPQTLREVTRLAFYGFECAHEFMGLQLSLAHGNISQEEFDEAAKGYFARPKMPDAVVKKAIPVLLFGVGVALDAATFSTIFHCDMGAAEEVIRDIVKGAEEP